MCSDVVHAVILAIEIVAKTPIIGYYFPHMVNHMRHTSGHSGNRRSHHALKAVVSTLCKDCGAPKGKHTACSNCGKYKGRDILAKKVKATKKTKQEKKAAVKAKVDTKKVEGKEMKAKKGRLFNRKAI